MRRKILALLEEHRIMTLATLRPDGWPQATTVGYASEGLTLYFLCSRDSQKAANIARDNRVSLTIDHDTDQVMEAGGGADLPPDAGRDLRAGLQPGLRARGSRALLRAPSRAEPAAVTS